MTPITTAPAGLPDPVRPDAGEADRTGGDGRADGLGGLLAEAVDLLRALPRHRDDLDRARQIAGEWAAARPASGATLVVDEQPGQQRVDFDLLLDDPRGGTVAVNVQDDDGVPWSVDHATHWAAGQVLTIDGLLSLSVPEALLTLRLAGLRDPAVHERLIDHCLLADLAAADRAEPSPEQRQAAADRFRRAQGLHSAEATLAWLDEIGMPRDAFDRYVTGLARLAGFRARKEAELGPGYLAAHPERFESLHATWATCADPATAGRLAAGDPLGLAERAARLLAEGRAVRCTSAVGFADELPPPLRDLPAGQPVGPVVDGGRLLVGVLTRREAPEPGPELAAAAGRAAFADWLAGLRARADIRWHWL